MPKQDFEAAAVAVSPLTVLVRGVLEWTFPDQKLRELYGQMPRVWTRSLTIEALFWLVVQVVSGARSAMFAAYRADQALERPTIGVSYQAMYDKLGRMALPFGTALVRESAARLQPLLEHARPRHYPGLKPYRVRIIDGTDLGGTEHRLAVLRKIKAAGLPGRLVVAYDWATGICCDAIASADAYTSERTLAQDIFAQSRPQDLFVMDRHYSTTAVMQTLAGRRGYFLVREHAENLRCRPLEKARHRGRVTTGRVSEQLLEVEDTRSGATFSVRRLILQLDQPTEAGETEIRLLSNLPASLSSSRLVELYRERWTIERHFDFLKNCLRGEIESLGKPAAAVFMMFMSLVTGNALAVVREAIRVTHGETEQERLSGYYLADELARNYHAVDVLMNAAAWRKLSQLETAAFWDWTQKVVRSLRPAAFYKHPRGPKKPPPKRQSGKHRHHYSTYRLLRDDGKIP